jgi:plasmid stability protein
MKLQEARDSAMKNVTITLDEQTAAWARVYAAQHGKSVSRLIGEMLRERMQERRAYDEAMQCYLGKQPVRLKSGNAGYPKREELYDR